MTLAEKIAEAVHQAEETCPHPEEDPCPFILPIQAVLDAEPTEVLWCTACDMTTLPSDDWWDKAIATGKCHISSGDGICGTPLVRLIAAGGERG